MSILNLIIVVVVIGLILWVINNYIPMEASIKKILNVTVIIVLVVWLLKVFGVPPPYCRVENPPPLWCEAKKTNRFLWLPSFLRE